MRIVNIAILFCLFLWGSTRVAAHEAIESFSNIKRGDGSTIQYYIEKSLESANSNKLVIVFQGSDCNSVQHNTFIQKHIHQFLPSADVLLVEKPGISPALKYNPSPGRDDCPTYYLHNDNPNLRVRDAQKVARHVLASKRYKQLIAAGGSEGATVALMFAERSKLPDAVIFINGGGRWFRDDVLHNIRLTSTKDKLPEELDGFNSFAEHILQSQPFNVEASNHGYAWWKSMLTLDQESIMRHIEVPVLIVQGGEDKSVSPDSVKNMVAGLRKSGRTNIELMFYPDLNHGLSTTDGKDMASRVLTDINLWLNAKLGHSPNKSFQAAATQSLEF